MQEFNTVIVGAGIVGAGIFRDLSMHNVSTLIIDKFDFSSKTSQASSKMLHGGIRYLENMDFHLVFEALHEKNLWLKIAPHLCYEEKFYLPVFDNSKRPLWMIGIGLFLYDLLSGFENTPFELKSAEKVIQKLKILNNNKLHGAGIYCDAIVDDSKMTLELIYDALLNSKCKARNYNELLKDEVNGDFHILSIKDRLNDLEYKVKCKNVVYACGPFTDDVLNKMASQEKNYCWDNFLIPSKGSHLWFNKSDFPLTSPVVMTINDEKGDRIIFVIPQNELVLVGTTELKTTEDFANVKISDDEIEYLLKNLNNYFPSIPLNKEHIIGRFSGIRPLVREGQSNDLGKTSREHRIIQPMHNVFVIAGGKYTTFRVMGQEITRNIVLKNNQSYNCDLSTHPLRVTSTLCSFKYEIPSENQLENILKNEMPKSLDDLVKRRMGICSKKFWDQIFPISFEEYFSKNLNLINKYFPLDQRDLENDFGNL